jgi:DNA-binding MarR family transcriptional regulator
VDPADRRRTVLHLTRRGRRVAEDPTGTVEAAVGAAVSRSTSGQRAATQTFLEELARSLDRELSRGTRQVAP